MKNIITSLLSIKEGGLFSYKERSLKIEYWIRMVFLIDIILQFLTKDMFIIHVVCISLLSVSSLIGIFGILMYKEQFDKEHILEIRKFIFFSIVFIIVLVAFLFLNK
ncbi:MAG: hypothetical protein ACK5LC_17845 [Coprobacillaceae bacterium]